MKVMCMFCEKSYLEILLFKRLQIDSKVELHPETTIFQKINGFVDTFCFFSVHWQKILRH